MAEQKQHRPQGDKHKSKREHNAEHGAVGEYLCEALFISFPCTACHLYLHTAAQTIADHGEYQVKNTRYAIHP